MTIVPRHVRPQVERPGPADEAPLAPLEHHRRDAAWVLLGEPGSGKSEALRGEARATGGVYLTIADFINLEPVHRNTKFTESVKSQAPTLI